MQLRFANTSRLRCNNLNLVGFQWEQLHHNLGVYKWVDFVAIAKKTQKDSVLCAPPISHSWFVSHLSSSHILYIIQLKSYFYLSTHEGDQLLLPSDSIPLDSKLPFGNNPLHHLGAWVIVEEGFSNQEQMASYGGPNRMMSIAIGKRSSARWIGLSSIPRNYGVCLQWPPSCSIWRLWGCDCQVALAIFIC